MAYQSSRGCTADHFRGDVVIAVVLDVVAVHFALVGCWDGPSLRCQDQAQKITFIFQDILDETEKQQDSLG